MKKVVLMASILPATAFAGTGPGGFIFGSGYEIAAGALIIAAIGAKKVLDRSNQDDID